MRRPILLTLAALGGLIVLIGGTGIFAALSDTARSGTNSIETDALPGSADLRVAEATGAPIPGGEFACGPFGENLPTPLITVAGQPGTLSQESFYCLRNAGSQLVNISVQLEEFDDVETGCTGDESIYDLSCGAGPGEISNLTIVSYARVDCDGHLVTSLGGMLLRDHQAAAFNLWSLAPGESACFGVSINVTGVYGHEPQAAQSDRVTWRFVWIGQV
jgi:hypothetical protein